MPVAYMFYRFSIVVEFSSRCTHMGEVTTQGGSHAAGTMYRYRVHNRLWQNAVKTNPAIQLAVDALSIPSQTRTNRDNRICTVLSQALGHIVGRENRHKVRPQ